MRRSNQYSNVETIALLSNINHMFSSFSRNHITRTQGEVPVNKRWKVQTSCSCREGKMAHLTSDLANLIQVLKLCTIRLDLLWPALTRSSHQLTHPCQHHTISAKTHMGYQIWKVLVLADQCQTVVQPKNGAKTADINPTKPRKKTPNLREMWPWYIKSKNSQNQFRQAVNRKKCEKYHDQPKLKPRDLKLLQTDKQTNRWYKINFQIKNLIPGKNIVSKFSCLQILSKALFTYYLKFFYYFSAKPSLRD